MNTDRQKARFFHGLGFLSVFICVHLWLLPPVGFAQEVVANLAAGRVMICVASNGIAVATVENRIEAESRPPIVVPLSGHRIGILLGAVEWVHPDAPGRAVRLDRELPRLLSAMAGPKRLQAEQAGDIEQIGLALLEPLRAAAAQIHRKLDLAPEEPLLELLLVGYEEEYGPEVWKLSYRVVQEPWRGDYWQTRVLRPRYDQLYPPEKGQPRTLIEVHYPLDDKSPALLDLLKHNDPRLARIRLANEQLAKAAQQLDHGETNKAQLEGVTDFLRAALAAIEPRDREATLAVIHQQKGIQWIVKPKEAPQPAGEDTQDENRAPGAPTLRRKPPASR